MIYRKYFGSFKTRDDIAFELGYGSSSFSESEVIYAEKQVGMEDPFVFVVWVETKVRSRRDLLSNKTYSKLTQELCITMGFSDPEGSALRLDIRRARTKVQLEDYINYITEDHDNDYIPDGFLYRFWNCYRSWEEYENIGETPSSIFDWLNENRKERIVTQPETEQK